MRLGRTWRRRSSITATQIALITATLIAVGAVGLASGAPSGVIEEAFGGQGNAEDARDRVTLYEQSIDLAQERPIFGSGVARHERREIPIDGISPTRIQRSVASNNASTCTGRPPLIDGAPTPTSPNPRVRNSSTTLSASGWPSYSSTNDISR